MAGFTYGNSTTRTITPNTRQLPGQILDSRFGVKLLDHLLTYDANANLGGITDGVPGGLESRTLGNRPVTTPCSEAWGLIAVTDPRR